MNLSARFNRKSSILRLRKIGIFFSQMSAFSYEQSYFGDYVFMISPERKATERASIFIICLL